MSSRPGPRKLKLLRSPRTSRRPDGDSALALGQTPEAGGHADTAFDEPSHSRSGCGSYSSVAMSDFASRMARIVFLRSSIRSDRRSPPIGRTAPCIARVQAPATGSLAATKGRKCARGSWAGASLYCRPPYSRISIRSRTPSPSSKPCYAKQPSEPSTVSGPPSDTSSISSCRRMSKPLRRRRIRCNVIGYRSRAPMPSARLESRWP